jgi:hypothetical protein
MYSPNNCDDIVVGEHHYNKAGGHSDDGRIHIFNGNSLSFSGAENTATITFNSPSAAVGENFGGDVAVGDLNPGSTTNDYDDILVGAPWNNEQGQQGGRAYFYLADDVAGGGFSSSSVTDLLNPGSSPSYDYFGQAVFIIDYEEEGNGDKFIGAPDAESTGTQRGAVYRFDGISTSIEETFSGSQNVERLGSSIGGGKYVNDSNVVIAMGAPNWDDWEEFPITIVADAGRVMVAMVPEFHEMVMPVASMIIIFAVFRRKWILNCPDKRSSSKDRYDGRDRIKNKR